MNVYLKWYMKEALRIYRTFDFYQEKLEEEEEDGEEANSFTFKGTQRVSY